MFCISVKHNLKQPFSNFLLFFQVTARWLLDLEEYNEWMNEEDYLVEEEVSYIVENNWVHVVSENSTPSYHPENWFCMSETCNAFSCVFLPYQW